jgi:HprK-related kinase A
VSSAVEGVAAYLRSHYGQFPIDDEHGAHFSVDVARPSGLRRWMKPQVVFTGDGQRPFHPLPAQMAPAMFEWGLNWCIARRVHHLLVIHCAVVSRHRRAVLLPAPPESGKSTLCAALVAHGWDFGSDEFCLVNPETGDIHPLPRPISLKNGAGDIIAARWPDAHFAPEVLDPEGTRIRYLRAPAQSVLDAQRVVSPRWVAIPRYRPGSPTTVEASSRARILTHLADSSYNFSGLGQRGLDCLAAIADKTRGFTLTYSNIDEALALFDRLDEDDRNEDRQARAGTAA